MPSETNGPSFSSIVGTTFVLGWLGIKAYELYEAYRNTILTEQLQQQQLQLEEEVEQAEQHLSEFISEQQPQIRLQQQQQQLSEQRHEQLMREHQQLRRLERQWEQRERGRELRQVNSHRERPEPRNEPSRHTVSYRRLALEAESLMGLPGIEDLGGMDFTNLQLSMLDRDFTEDDYEMLLGLDFAGGAGPSVSQEQINRLPHYNHRVNTDTTGQVSAAVAMVRNRLGGDSSSSTSEPAVVAETLTCCICLEDVREGSKVMALRCMHKFHTACLEPWLKQQGLACTCPVCKSYVFCP